MKIRPAGPFSSGEINEAQLTDGAALGHVDFAIAARMSFDHPEKMFIHQIALDSFSLALLHHKRRRTNNKKIRTYDYKLRSSWES